MAELHAERPVTAARRDRGSAVARAGDALPFRPDICRGGQRPARAAPVPAWLAAERHGTFAAGPGSGWDPLAAREAGEVAAAPRKAAVAIMAARCKACGYLVTAPGHAIECGGSLASVNKSGGQP